MVGPASSTTGPWRRVGVSRSVTESQAEARMRVAARPAKIAELTQVGWSWQGPALPPEQVVQLFRLRPSAASRELFCARTGATHIVGDDALSPVERRGGPLEEAMWWVGTPWSASGSGQSVPLVLFPQHLERLKNRIHAELERPEGPEAVVVVVTVARAAVDAAMSWDEFARVADRSLVSGWGAGMGVTAVTVFTEAPELLRIPRGTWTAPPPTWTGVPLAAQRMAVALRVSRCGSGGTPTFARVGTAPTVAAVRVQERAGLVPVVVEVALPQRPMEGKIEARAFCQRALADLVGVTDAPILRALLPSPQGLVLRGDMLSGIVDLPAALAARVVRASGSVRGVFARPMFGGSVVRPLPPGFTVDSHRVVWARVERYSDLVHQRLLMAGVEFAGLVCGRSRKEVGIRVPAGTNQMDVVAALEGELEARVKVRAAGESRRTMLVARQVPVALLYDLGQVVARLGEGLRVVEARTLACQRYTADVRLTVEGVLRAGEEWILHDLGVLPVIVRRHTPQRRGPAPVSVPASARVTGARPLQPAERVSWATVARGGPPAAHLAPSSASAAMEGMDVDSVAAPVDPRAEAPPRPRSPTSRAAVVPAAPHPSKAKGIQGWLAPKKAAGPEPAVAAGRRVEVPRPAPSVLPPRAVPHGAVVAAALPVVPPSTDLTRELLVQVQLLNSTVRELQAQLQALREENALLRRRQATGEEGLPAPKRACGAGAGSVATSGNDTAMPQAEEGATSATSASGAELRQRLQHGGVPASGTGLTRRVPANNDDGTC